MKATDRPPQRIGAAGAQHMLGEEVWLVGEHRSNGERKYYLSNLPVGTAIKDVAGAITARWACEQAHQQLKEELGPDHFEGRSWTGLHHHALMTEILEVIGKAETRHALDVSRRFKQSIGQIFRFAIASGRAASVPTVHPPSSCGRGSSACQVPLKEVRAIIAYDCEADHHRRQVTRNALMFTLPTWARTSNRLCAPGPIEDPDGPEPLWRLSFERRRWSARDLVPLCPAVVAIMRRRPRATQW